MSSSSAKDALAILRTWDSGNSTLRRKILEDFIMANRNRTAAELDEQFADAASLFFTRLTAWLRLVYMTGNCLNELLDSIQIFVSSSGGLHFVNELLEVGGLMTLLEVITLKQANEDHKQRALKVVFCVANAGRRYKELVCESYGIRAVAECLAKSNAELTMEHARQLLQLLADGNPKFEVQVYKGLIALLPASNPRTQQMALQALRFVQPIVKNANQALVEPLLDVLKTQHLEVQYEAIEYIKELMVFGEVRGALLQGLVAALAPASQVVSRKAIVLQSEPDTETAPLPIMLQQAAAAKAINGLCKQSRQTSVQLLQFQAVRGLLFAMGTREHADSQLQATLALTTLCRAFPLVAQCVHAAVGAEFFELFVSTPEMLYTLINPIQADVLVSNRVTIDIDMDSGEPEPFETQD